MSFRISYWVLLFTICLASDVQPTNALSIENDFVLATWNPETSRLSVEHKPSGTTFLQDAKVLGTEGKATLTTVRDKIFGNGQAIEFHRTEGSSCKMQVFPGLPFVLISTQLHNSGSSELSENHIEVATLPIDWGVKPEALKTFGTGGLLGISENPGSYAWLSAVNPESRNGVVVGWLTHDRGSGVLFSREEDSKFFMDARLDYGRLLLAPGESVPLETLAIGFFEDARFGLESWADAVARVYEITLPPQPTGYCTWYSDPHGGASDEKHLAELAAFAAKNLAPCGFSFVQIDDKWQSGISHEGPRRNFTTHDAKGPYPSGMKHIADKIRDLALTPGIWFMPFAGTSYDPFFAQHQDWFVKTVNGSPYETKWGGTCLDMSNPGARQHLKSIVLRIAHDWGFQYFKIDGLWTGTGTPLRYVNRGYVDDGIGDAVFHDPRKTNIEIYRDGLKLVRDAAGPNVFILGCNGPQNMRSYGGAIGLVDAMRIGPDNGPKWQQLMKGPLFGSRHYFLHGRVWYNDPDPVYVRDSIPLTQAQLICSWVAITGQLNVSSDWLPGLSEERVEILKRTMPSHDLLPRPVDLFTHDPPRIWTLQDTRRVPSRHVIGLFNWEEETRELTCSFKDIDLDEGDQYIAYDYWSDTLLNLHNSTMKVRVPGKACKILALRSVSDHPQVLSTSRHVTQGILDVIEETWSEKDRVLSGKSQLLGETQYELKIVVPDSTWKAKSVDATTANGKRRSVDVENQENLLRVRMESPSSGEISWSVAF